jgi:hypothetical protein
MSRRFAAILVVALGVLALSSTQPMADDDPKEDAKATVLHLGKVEETEAKVKLDEPTFGYEGHLGSFAVTKRSNAIGLIVAHDYPDTSKFSLGRTKLAFEGAKRLGNIDGWVFKTEWDGKTYPSKIFFSAQKVYFAGGVNAYIAADYREGTGWAWKLHPLRRMGLLKGGKE